MKKILYITAGIISATLVVAMVVTASIWPMINEVETGATPEYPDIQPHYYSTQPVDIYDEALEVVDQLERWRRVDEDVSTHTIEAERTTRVFGFVDEVTIRVEPVTEFVSQVHVHSRSRIGEADFGQNARNIEQFLGELEARLGAVKFDPGEESESSESGSSDEDQQRGNGDGDSSPDPADG